MNSSASSKYTASVKNSLSLKLYTKRRKMPLTRAVAMPIPAEVKVAATWRPPCLYGALSSADKAGKSVEVIG